MRKVVILPGGYHPFHAGHYALYNSALKAFPDADVYLAATNDTKTRPFPFEIKKKLAKLAGVDSSKFVQVTNPFKSTEITNKYDPNEDVLIFVRSEKDKSEYPMPGGMKKDGTPSYFQPWTGKNLKPFAQRGYLAYLPTVEFGPGIQSASEIRDAWPRLNNKQKLAMVFSLYPRTQANKNLANNVIKMFDHVLGTSAQSEISESSNSEVHFGKNLLSILQKKYPDTEFELRSDGGVNSEDMELVVIAVAMQEDDYVGCYMWDVDTGPYKGALAQAIKQTTEELLHNNPGSKPALFIGGDNQNPVAWAHIAKKLNYKLITEDDDDSHDLTNENNTMNDMRKLMSVVENASSEKNEKSASSGGIGDLSRAELNATADENEVIAFIRRHYPEAPNTQAAFIKFVIHSLEHSEEDAVRHEREIESLKRELKRLERKVTDLESPDDSL